MFSLSSCFPAKIGSNRQSAESFLVYFVLHVRKYYCITCVEMLIECNASIELEF